LEILKLSTLKFIIKLSHSSPPYSNKLFVADTALNFWIKNFVMPTIQDSLKTVQCDHHMQPITKSTNRLQLYCLSQCQNPSPQLPINSHSTVYSM